MPKTEKAGTSSSIGSHRVSHDSKKATTMIAKGWHLGEAHSFYKYKEHTMPQNVSKSA